MNPPRPLITSCLIALAAVALLLAMYVAAYFCMMSRADFGIEVTPIYTWPFHQEAIDEGVHDAAARFFAPVHRVDRVLRPQAWQPRTDP